ncbi:hypothetical protein A6X20_02700 [Bradyrhizobium elkanii]|nr:hypothetical protein A6X20_02700 [Bradyrhizobium elkanii]ODM84126.1 hypothetical protein A6452_15190 [Bradyrhizobium elkanii]
MWYGVIFRVPLQTSKNTIAELDGPMTCGYGIDAIDTTRKKSASNAAMNREQMRRGGKIFGHCGREAAPDEFDRRLERRSIRSDIRDRELSQIILIAGLSACIVGGSSGVRACMNFRANAENVANGAEVCGLQQECALLHVEFSLQHESALERILFALGAVAEADAHLHPFQRQLSAPGLKTNSHSGACGERRAKKVVRIGTGRHVAGSIWAADGKP